MNAKLVNFLKDKIIESGADMLGDCWHEYEEIYEITGKDEPNWKYVEEEYAEAIKQLKAK